MDGHCVEWSIERDRDPRPEDFHGATRWSVSRRAASTPARKGTGRKKNSHCTRLTGPPRRNWQGWHRRDCCARTFRMKRNGERRRERPKETTMEQDRAQVPKLVPGSIPRNRAIPPRLCLLDLDESQHTKPNLPIHSYILTANKLWLSPLDQFVRQGSRTYLWPGDDKATPNYDPPKMTICAGRRALTIARELFSRC